MGVLKIVLSQKKECESERRRRRRRIKKETSKCHLLSSRKVKDAKKPLSLMTWSDLKMISAVGCMEIMGLGTRRPEKKSIINSKVEVNEIY